LSELVKPSPNEKVIDWLTATPDERLFLSVITIGEIRKGLTKLPESKKKTSLTNWLNTLLDDYQNRIYEINLTVAENWGIIQGSAENSGNPIASVDSLIAAVVYTYNLTLVTRNEKDFIPSKIPILNPWVSAGRTGGTY
jgi:predicted nucleic acid-binding protein